MDMRAGTDTALARVVSAFGATHPHTAYLFANTRANRMKVLVHDGIGVSLPARRLNQGTFVWPRARPVTMTFTCVQLDALGRPRTLGGADPEQFLAGSARQAWNCTFGQWLPICPSVSEPSGNGDTSDGFIMIHQLV